VIKHQQQPELTGEILAYSTEPGKVKRNNVDLKLISDRIETPNSLNILGNDPRSHETME